jgi:hypothetical protein
MSIGHDSYLHVLLLSLFSFVFFSFLLHISFIPPLISMYEWEKVLKEADMYIYILFCFFLVEGERKGESRVCMCVPFVHFLCWSFRLFWFCEIKEVLSLDICTFLIVPKNLHVKCFINFCLYSSMSRCLCEKPLITLEF